MSVSTRQLTACILLTTVPRRATFEPAARTRASTTLPKLPSPMSFNTSNLSSNACPGDPIGVDNPRWVKSYATVMVNVLCML